jgi:hypothetical protein
MTQLLVTLLGLIPYGNYVVDHIMLILHLSPSLLIPIKVQLFKLALIEKTLLVMYIGVNDFKGKKRDIHNNHKKIHNNHINSYRFLSRI